VVQVHEIHVNLAPREIAVKLRVQMQERLSQCRESPIHIFDGDKVCIHRIKPAQLGALLASRRRPLISFVAACALSAYWVLSQRPLDAVETSTHTGLRDRALLGVLAYTFAESAP
jgi:hypothetical protein